MAFSPDPFFIGWAKKPPKALQGFLVIVTVTLVAGLAAAGIFLGASQADPEGGRFRFDLGVQQLTGTLIARPYPMIWLDDGPAPNVNVRTRMIMLNGNGKTGVAARAVGIRRQSRHRRRRSPGARRFANAADQSRLRGRARRIGPAAGVREDLGIWRLSGEICDGRCYVGAMRPGDGLAHKACANLCIDGGQPPVFVTPAPVEGTRFMLMGSSDHGPLPPGVLDFAGMPVQLEGRLERIGDLVLLLVDPDSIDVL